MNEWDVRVDDLSGPATRALIAFHLEGMRASSPPGSMHALDIAALRHPDITFWSLWAGDEVAGITALKRLDADRGEIKSMRVDDRFRGRGIGRMLLNHVVDEARARGLASLWLETGATEEFAPARRLYESEGFGPCEAFPPYRADPFSVFMTRAL